MSEKINKNISEIDLENGVFRKYVPADKFRCELQMNKEARKLTLNNGLFEVPDIKFADAENYVIEFELIKDIKMLRAFFITNAKFGALSKEKSLLYNLFNRIGKALSLIHNIGQNFDDDSKKTFPKDFFHSKFEKDLVFIHGDFTLSNILYNENSNNLYIIDWSTSPVFDFSANFGPRYWDLSFFVSSLFYFSVSTIFSYQLRISLLKEFLAGYLFEKDIDRKIFSANFKEFFSSYNYYKLYDSIYKSDKNIMTRLLVAYTNTKLNNIANLIPSLVNK